MDFKEYFNSGVSPSHGYAPEVVKGGTIVIHDYRRTPIHIQLSDGTNLFLTRREYEKIGGYKPERGGYMEVTLQRHPANNSRTPSRVVRAVVTRPPD